MPVINRRSVSPIVSTVSLVQSCLHQPVSLARPGRGKSRVMLLLPPLVSGRRCWIVARRPSSSTRARSVSSFSILTLVARRLVYSSTKPWSPREFCNDARFSSLDGVDARSLFVVFSCHQFFAFFCLCFFRGFVIVDPPAIEHSSTTDMSVSLAAAVIPESLALSHTFPFARSLSLAPFRSLALPLSHSMSVRARSRSRSYVHSPPQGNGPARRS